MPSYRRIAWVFGALLTTASAGQAFDATGTWEGSVSCRHFDGAKFRFKNKLSTLHISQSGTDLNAEFAGGVFQYHGHAIDDDGKPGEEGEVLLVQCGTDEVAGAGFGEMLRAAVKTKPAKGTGSLRGTSIFEGDFGGGWQFGTCKYQFKRTSTANPGVSACP
jgi:hypothetical protein